MIAFMNPPYGICIHQWIARYTILQQDGRISNVTLAKRLSLSEAPCWRRLQRLEESGSIEGYQAIIGLGIVEPVGLVSSMQSGRGVKSTI
jgi:predicted ArsR family transcriptional regulator